MLQIAPTFWSSYGAGSLALVGFVVNGILMYGSAQKLAGQREAQRIADRDWRKEHEAQSNLRDVAIAALQTQASSNDATVKAIQTQLGLIQVEIRESRWRGNRDRDHD